MARARGVYAITLSQGLIASFLPSSSSSNRFQLAYHGCHLGRRFAHAATSVRKGTTAGIRRRTPSSGGLEGAGKAVLPAAAAAAAAASGGRVRQQQARAGKRKEVYLMFAPFGILDITPGWNHYRLKLRCHGEVIEVAMVAWRVMPTWRWSSLSAGCGCWPRAGGSNR